MASNSEEDNFLINIVEELDDDDNVKNFKLERINNKKDELNEEYDLLAQKLQLDVEKQKKHEASSDVDQIVNGVKENLDYKKGFLNSIESKNRSTKEKLKKVPQIKQNSDSKYTEKEAKPVLKPNEKSKILINSTPDQSQSQSTGKDKTENTENSSSSFDATPQIPPMKPKAKTSANLKDKKYSSLFIKPKNKQVKKGVVSNRKENAVNNDKKEAAKTKPASRFAQKLENEKKIMFSTTKKKAPVEYMNVSPTINATKETNQSENNNKPSQVSEDVGTSDIKKNIEKVNKKIYENMPLEIATEELYELHLDNETSEVDCNDEELITDYDEDYLYQRVFPWFKPINNEKQINPESEDGPKSDDSSKQGNSEMDNVENQEIVIHGVNFDEQDDEEEDGLIQLEKPIIDERILESVKDKLAYKIENDMIEIIDDIEEVDQTYIEKKSKPESKSIIKKSSFKANCEDNSSEKPKVNFSNVVMVKEIENKEEIKMQELEEVDNNIESEKIQEKLRLDKMYKEIFGDEYQKIQKQIIENTKSFGFESALDVDVPQSLRDEAKKSEEEEDDEVKFEDIVSNTIVERSIVSQDFETPVVSKKKFGNSRNLTMTNDYIVARNTQNNKYL